MIPIHGEFASADARFTLYLIGTKTSVTVDSNDRVVVGDIIYDYTGATTRVITVYDGGDNTVDAGEKICETSLAQNNHSESHGHVVPFTCQVGTYPKVKASGAGQITVLFRGFIQRIE